MKLTKYQSRIINKMLKNSLDWVKYPSDKFYMMEFKKGGKWKKTLLGQTVTGILIDCSDTYCLHEKKEIFGGTLLSYKVAEYLKTEIEV